MPRAKAFEVAYNGYTYYVAVIDGQELLKSSFVSRRAEDGERGFNRALAPSRAREISRYLDDERSSIPTNVVLSAQPEANLRFSRSAIEWDAGEHAFLVLDGQHRLYSMSYTEHDYPLAVAIYSGLTREAEVRLFIDINTKQKGVPPALLLDIKQLAGVETSLEELLRRLFDYVGSAEGSPLYGLLSPASTKPGTVSRVTFNVALKRPMEAGILAQTDNDEDRGKLVVNYLRAADRILRQSGAQTSSLTRATVLQAFFELFNEVVDATLRNHKSLKDAQIAKTLSPLADLDFDSYGGGNRPSKTKLVSDMRAKLTEAPRLTSNML
ncbi:DGQHR domain-containing protein [Micromonospora humida]|uniref:DGQHR domain-containing protein n=1 Tax=Micromonospora humida TaxID=2809018 RepID=A0ABS2IUM9_9ACTN|nr:DGQHR domain-containing protein [Micromonospora humida]MBM7078053.1 DGQHR domain-containing protein [Micromonospora humida]